MQNIGYLSSFRGSNFGLVYRLIILIPLTLLIFKWRKKLGFPFTLFSLMFGFGLYGVFLAERPYPHYLIEVAPWFSLLLMLLIFQKKIQQLIIILILTSLTFSGVKIYKFWWYTNLPYYQNFLNFFLLEKSIRILFFIFLVKIPLIIIILPNISRLELVLTNEFFIWGDGACIYALADRLPASRYTVNYHLDDFNGFDETFLAIEKYEPKIIVLLEPLSQKFPQLNTLLNNYYVKADQVDKAVIYQNLFSHGKN